MTWKSWRAEVLSVDTKKRSEEWKGANNTEISTFNLRWRKQKGSKLENQLSDSYKTLMSMRRGKDWCLSPSSSSLTILSAYTRVACSVCCTGTPTNQRATCCFIYWYQMESQDDSDTDQDSPVWEARWTSDHSSAKCTSTLPTPSLSYTFQHYHCSLTNTQGFFNKWHASCCEN